MGRPKKGYSDKYKFTSISVGETADYDLTELADRKGSQRAIEVAYNRLRCAAAISKMQKKAELMTRRNGDVVTVTRLK